MTAKKQNREISVRPRIMETAYHFYVNPGRTVTREELLASLWEGVTVSEQSVTKAVSELRKILGDCKDQPALIETISKTGYRIKQSVSLNNTSSTWKRFLKLIPFIPGFSRVFNLKK